MIWISTWDALELSRKSSIASMLIILLKQRVEIATLLSTFLVREYYIADSRFSVRVRDCCLRAKINDTQSFRPVIITCYIWWCREELALIT